MTWGEAVVLYWNCKYCNIKLSNLSDDEEEEEENEEGEENEEEDDDEDEEEEEEEEQQQQLNERGQGEQELLTRPNIIDSQVSLSPGAFLLLQLEKNEGGNEIWSELGVLASVDIPVWAGTAVSQV